MQPSRVSRPYPLSSSPSPVSPPGTTKPVSALAPPATHPIWLDHPSLDTTSDEGTSRFFSSRTSSDTNSTDSTSPPRWSAQPPSQTPTQPICLRPYPSMLLAHDLPREPDFRLQAPSAAERELHVVLPEPWMDAPYVLHMAHTQGWDILDVRMQPHGAVLVFASATGAARAFTQVNSSPEGVCWIGAGAGARVQAHWAGAVGRANEEDQQTYVAARPGAQIAPGVGPNVGKQLEFSIFVGDLAPETTNADLVAVFRNPLLGLRPDREPRVNPETGVSKGYGFVRFTDEADQQRALIEMQGLYCLSRPMRLSHATAKTKPTTSNATNGAGGFNQHPADERDSYVAGRAHEIYGRLGQDTYGSSGRHHSASGPVSDMGFFSNSGLPRPRSVDAEDLFNAEMGATARVLGVEAGRAAGLSEGAKLESARALLLGAYNSADPYNTTVFVGGLSGLIAEETLRGFFAPFGEIHYVKIPPGKGCGFVQFVRKADAERAIERMQGFPIGGGKIRLSWGRSQSDKAAQAAAQAAQLGLNLGGLHLNSLSAADSTRLFQTLEAIGYSSVPQTQGAGPAGQQNGGFQSQQLAGFQNQQLGGFQGTQAAEMFPSKLQSQAGTSGFHGPNSVQHPQNLSPPIQSPPANQFAHVYESGPSPTGMSRAYSSSAFQPFSNDLVPGYGRRTSLAFEPEVFGLQTGRERQQSAPLTGIKNLNLGLASLNLNQRREFGLDGGPFSAPLSNNNSNNHDNVYIH